MAYVLDTTIALTTLERAKEQCQIPDAETEIDNIMTRFINEASQRIENMTKRKLKSRTFTEYQDGSGNSRILTRQWPVISVAEVWLDSSSEFTDAAKMVDSSYYHIDQQNEGLVMRGGCRKFTRGIRNVKLVYDAGYATIPADLEGACLWMIEFLYEARSDERIGTSTKSKGDENVSFLQDVPEFIKDTIDKYTRFEFPLSSIAVEAT